MALDTLDFVVIGAIVVGAILYFGKDYIWPSDDGTSAGFTANLGGKSRNLVTSLKDNDKNTLVFYGSQTGTAEDYAHKLSKELASRFGLKVLVGDLSDFDYDNLNEVPEDVLCFFLLATYGEGEPTDDAVEFIDYLDNEADELSNIKFSVFGLGNSTYEFYNEMGTKVDTKFEELGAQRFAPLGKGDDGIGTLDEDYLAWKDEMFDSLKNNLDFEEHELTYDPSIKIIDNDELTIDDARVAVGEPNKSYLDPTKDLSKGPFGSTHPYLSKITTTKELFNSKERSCIHVEFDLSSTNLRYTTGDHLAVWPSNSDYNINNFVKAFGLEDKLSVVFDIKALDSTITIPFPTPTTYEAVIRHHLEISGPISRQFFVSIAGFAPNEETKALVAKIGNDKELFASEIHSKHYNMADALLKLSNGQPWSNVPFEFLIESIGHLQPRYYSISSSSLSEKTSIHITAVVEAEEVDGRYVTGVVTNLLKNIELEQNNKSEKPLLTYDLKGPRDRFNKFKLPVHVRRSTFKLPSNPSVPIILIGPGTGVAPFRGFVREKIAVKESSDSPIGQIALFFGCRKSDEDFLYKDEWPEYAKKLGDKFEMYTAFSREGDKKNYVQHKLLEKSASIAQLIKDGAYIYVCGDASKMARDVQQSLTQILAKERGIPEEKASDLIRGFKVQNRYQEDVW